ncbi:hypothetical protein QAD02_009135 [Eretmocerus hayati]|uniref:Uncharacterized protein n=1 Tax=Eretmocerus hayati TaxID=131215 RepID=A0ACC2N8M1_9HYME|nr:hypothetical protein QAD02_009135 [Eretmocerus hayati]
MGNVSANPLPTNELSLESHENELVDLRSDEYTRDTEQQNIHTFTQEHTIFEENIEELAQMPELALDNRGSTHDRAYGNGTHARNAAASKTPRMDASRETLA